MVIDQEPRFDLRSKNQNQFYSTGKLAPDGSPITPLPTLDETTVTPDSANDTILQTTQATSPSSDNSTVSPVK